MALRPAAAEWYGGRLCDRVDRGIAVTAAQGATVSRRGMGGDLRSRSGGGRRAARPQRRARSAAMARVEANARRAGQ